MSDKPDSAGRSLLIGAVVSILVLCVLSAVWTFRSQEELEEMKAALAKSAKTTESIERIEERIDKLANDQEVFVDDVAKVSRKIDDLKHQLESRDRQGLVEAPEAPPQIDWTQPTYFSAAQTSAAEYGIELTKDEVRVPSRFVLKQGAIEYFAVLKGGKEHETLISLLGNTPADQRRPKDFGARFNNAVQAIGFKRGAPVKFTPTGTIPPKGDTAYLFVEWEEKGEKILARAEDLIWDRELEKPMEHGKWVYVGSTVIVGEDPNEMVLAADRTGEAVATYTQSPDTVFDDTSVGEFDDSRYLVASPRIPADVEKCTLVIRRIDREPTKTFPGPGDGK